MRKNLSYQPGQQVAVVLPSAKNRKESYTAIIIGLDEYADTEAYPCTITLPADENQPQRTVELPGGFTLTQLETNAQLSIFQLTNYLPL